MSPDQRTATLASLPHDAFFARVRAAVRDLLMTPRGPERDRLLTQGDYGCGFHAAKEGGRLDLWHEAVLQGRRDVRRHNEDNDRRARELGARGTEGENMANVNKLIWIGRLTRDPETRTFANGGKVCEFSLATNNRKKNQQTGQYEDDPVYQDFKGFNRKEGQQVADLLETLQKGQQVYIEGHLVREVWQGQDGQQRTKNVCYVDTFQFLEPKRDGLAPLALGGRQPAAATAPARDPGADEDIPF